MSNYLIGCMVCVAAAIATFVILETARHLQYLKHRDSGFVPGTQHWVLAATGIAFVFILGAITFMVLHAIRGA